VVRHFELEQVALFGTSYHGAIVANYASRNPATVLRVIQSGPISPRRVPHNEQATARLQARMTMPEMAQLMKSQDPAERSRLWNTIFARAYFFDPAAYASSLARPADFENEKPQNVMPRMNTFMSELGDWDWRPVAAGFSGPVLILHGDADWIPVESSQEWQMSFPNARMFIVPNAGHLAWLEQPEMFFVWLNDFLGDPELNHWRWPAPETPDGVK
jgi:proline iminopeptidase